MKHTTLMLTPESYDHTETAYDKNLDEAFGILGDLAGLYGDNGGDSDGNAYLPASAVTGTEADAVVDANLGKMVMASYTDVINFCSDISWLKSEVEQVSEINEHETPEYADIKEVLNYGEKRINGRTWRWCWSGFNNFGIVIYFWTED